MTTDDTTKPNPAGPEVSLDLDSLEREGTKEPFTFQHLGKRYMMSDPQEVDWQRLMIAMKDPVYFMSLVLPADDREQFFDADLPTWKLNKLMAAYTKHYGLPTPGEAAGSPA